MTHLFVLDVATRATRTLTSGAFTVGSFAWSPDGRSIAFDHRVNPQPANGGSADISIVTVADGVGPQAGDAGRPRLATRSGRPTASRIAFETAMANPAFFYTNSVIATVPAAGGAPTVLTAAFDEDPSIVAWKPSGLFFAASQRTYCVSVSRSIPTTKAVTQARRRPIGPVNSSFSLTQRRRRRSRSLASDARSMAGGLRRAG